jgi:hypothetical protein
MTRQLSKSIKQSAAADDVTIYRVQSSPIHSIPFQSQYNIPPILSYPILSYPILSYPILSYPILFYPILNLYPSINSSIYILPASIHTIPYFTAKRRPFHIMTLGEDTR